MFDPLGPQWAAEAPGVNATYEYIIVGSGAGGAPLAARLALAGHSVLLIDAGEDHHMERQVQIPALNGYASEYNPIRWEYFVDHYTNETQANKDSKMTWLTADGEYYVGQYPPEGAERLGIYYPRMCNDTGYSRICGLISSRHWRTRWMH
jgi:choline dehydrogenase